MGFGITPIEAPDSTPDPFNFTDLVDVQLNTVYSSNVIVPSGYNQAATVALVGSGPNAEYRIDNAPWTVSNGVINPGQSIQVRDRSSTLNGGTTVLFLDIDTVRGDFSLRTAEVSAFTAPPLYSQWVTQAIADLEETTSFMATAVGETIPGNDLFSDNGSMTVFYEQFAGIQQGRQWGVRTGNVINIDTTGEQAALQIARGRWNRPGAINQAIYRDADNWVEAWRIGYQYLDNLDTVGAGSPQTAGTNEITETISPHFNRDTMSSNGLGSGGNSPPIGRAFMTEYSRPTAKILKGCVFHREATGSDYLTANAGTYGANPIEFRSPMYNALIGNFYRFINEQVNTFSTGSLADSTANFMVGLSLDAFFANRDELVSRGEDPDLYFPGQGARSYSNLVLDGEIFGTESYEVTSNVICPWQSTYAGEFGLAVARDIIEWAWTYAILDMTGWGPDVLPPDSQLDFRQPPRNRAEFNAGGPGGEVYPLSPQPTYLRILHPHVGRNEVPGSFPNDDPRRLGDPMVRMNSNGVFNVLNRTGSPDQGGANANNAQNLQQICVYPCYALAAALRQNGAAEADIQRYVAVGDALWQGAVDYGDRDTQRARNQNQSTQFRAIAKRNIATGRND